MTKASDDNSAVALHDRALKFYLENRYTPAKKVLLENIDRHPEYVQSHLLLGQIYFFSRKPDYDEAAQKFRKVVELSPDWEEGHHWLGSALEQVGDEPGASVAFEKAIELAPDDPRPRVALGNIFCKLGQYKEAIDLLKTALDLKLHYTEADTRLFLADALLKNGELDEACAEWRRVLEIEPSYPSYEQPHKEAERLLEKHRADQ